MRLAFQNAIRRVFLFATKGGEWGIQGYEHFDYDSETDSIEGDGDDPADVFQGIGIYARPGAGSEAEGLLLHVGGEAEHPVLAAVRDEDSRRAYVETFGDIEPGEIVLFNSTSDARVILKIDGTIEIEASEIKVRSPGGSTDSLVTKTEFEAHVHATAGTGPPSTPTAPITGTTILKAE